MACCCCFLASHSCAACHRTRSLPRRCGSLLISTQAAHISWPGPGGKEMMITVNCWKEGWSEVGCEKDATIYNQMFLSYYWVLREHHANTVVTLNRLEWEYQSNLLRWSNWKMFLPLLFSETILVTFYLMYFKV